MEFVTTLPSEHYLASTPEPISIVLTSKNFSVVCTSNLDFENRLKTKKMEILVTTKFYFENNSLSVQ